MTPADLDRMENLANTPGAMDDGFRFEVPVRSTDLRALIARQRQLEAAVERAEEVVEAVRAGNLQGSDISKLRRSLDALKDGEAGNV